MAALHRRIGEQVELLTVDPEWRAMRDTAARLQTYSLGTQLPIALQACRAHPGRQAADVAIAPQ